MGLRITNGHTQQEPVHEIRSGQGIRLRVAITVIVVGLTMAAVLPALLANRSRLTSSQHTQPDPNSDSIEGSGVWNGAAQELPVTTVKEDAAVASEKASKKKGKAKSNTPVKSPSKKESDHSHPHTAHPPTAKETKHNQPIGSTLSEASKMTTPLLRPSASSKKHSKDPFSRFGWIGDTFAPIGSPVTPGAPLTLENPNVQPTNKSKKGPPSGPTKDSQNEMTATAPSPTTHLSTPITPGSYPSLHPTLIPSVPEVGGLRYPATPTSTRLTTEAPSTHTSHTHRESPSTSHGHGGLQYPTTMRQTTEAPSTHTSHTHRESPTTSYGHGRPVGQNSESGKGRSPPSNVKPAPTCISVDCEHGHGGHWVSTHWDTWDTHWDTHRGKGSVSDRHYNHDHSHGRGKGSVSDRHYNHDHSHGTPSAAHPQPIATGLRPTLSPTIIRTALTSGATAQQDSLGRDVLSALLRALPASRVSSVSIAGFPAGTAVSYIDFLGNNVTISGGDADGIEFTLKGSYFADLLKSLESIMVVNSPSDDDYELQVKAISRAAPRVSQTFSLPVMVTPATLP